MSLRTILNTIVDRFKRPASGRAEIQPQPDEQSFSYLAAHTTVTGWKRKLYSLINGESDETLSRLGSIEQYVRVLLAESTNPDAKYCFSEALSHIIQEWTPNVMEPAERLYNTLQLIAAFTPAVGFTKTLDYLNSCGSIKRSGERVASEYQLVDLYKRGLLALARYYPNAPQHSQSDQGFLAYTQLLEKNLEDQRYAGYVVGKLLDLNLLDIKSKKISALLLSSDDVFAEVFEGLIDAADDPEDLKSVEAKLGDLLVICAQSDNLEKFRSAAASLGVEFNPEGDYEVYFPTLALPGGTVLNIYLDMGEVRETALAHYVGYNRERLGELFASGSFEPDKISKYVSGYLTQVISDASAVEALVSELNHHKIDIVGRKIDFALRSRNPDTFNDIPLTLIPAVLIEYMKWRVKRGSVAGSSAVRAGTSGPLLQSLNSQDQPF